MKILRTVGLPAAALMVLVLGCADAPSPTDVPRTAESLEEATGERADGLLGNLVRAVESTAEDLTTVNTVRRTSPVGGPATCAVETVGPAGGVMECEEAGLRVVFPRGALDEATEISIHIPDRKLVGYEFAPHGLEFDKDVQLRQNLEGTELETDSSLLSRVVGAYVEEITPVADALEILDALLNGPEVRIDIEHFSGYVCATN